MEERPFSRSKPSPLVSSTEASMSSEKATARIPAFDKHFEENSPKDSDTSSESAMEDSVADLATDTGGCETTQSANADISPNGIERPAEEANQQHMTTQSLDGTDGLELSQLAEDTNRISRAPSRPPLIVPLQTNAQAQPAVCTTSGTIQVSQNSSSAEERDRMRGLCQLSEPDKEREHSISAEDFEPPQTQSPQRSLIVFLRYAPAKGLARASHIPGIGPVLERLENADESEIQGSSQPSEIDQEPEVSEPFNAAEAIQEPSVLKQTLELVKSFRRSNTEKRTSLQEASSQPSNSTLHMSSSSGLVEGRNQRRDVSLATSVAQGPDHSCPPEGCRRSFKPAALRPSSEYFDLPKPPELSSISLVQEATTISILTGGHRQEELHIPRLALEGMARSPANLMHNKIVLPPITSFSPTHDTLQSSALPSLAPRTHLHTTSISSNTSGQHTTNGNLQTPVSEAGNRKPFWSPGLDFRERITDLLLNGEDGTELCSLGQRGRSEVYDSHQHWTSNIMTASNVFQSLKSRLGDEYDSWDWIVSAQQCSRPQRRDADSGLFKGGVFCRRLTFTGNRFHQQPSHKNYRPRQVCGIRLTSGNQFAEMRGLLQSGSDDRFDEFIEPEESDAKLTEELMGFCLMVVTQDLEREKVYRSPLMHFLAVMGIDAAAGTLRRAFAYTPTLAAALWIN
ncbi:hypothetical protein V502_01995 [Pseudogymnoascus sp. VKM F-4520 (FW-2644)]|nr:hypothetical protein V502_01995 [Pseudogymnoascus sp. VKM F-4520 (FW-2644)]